MLFANTDQAMFMARSQARQTLPQALRTATISNGGLSSSLTLKVAIPVGRKSSGDTEVIWVGNLTRRSNDYTGNLQNEPSEILNKKGGSRVRFSYDQISDWALPGSDGRLYGHYTTRVMLGDLPASTRQQIERLLQPVPAPSNW